MQTVTLIKFGGAVITNKDIPESLRSDVLDRLVGELADAQKQSDHSFVLGNGAGSFAHVPASQYKTMDGFITEQSRMGMAITQDAAARLNRLVVHACLTHELPAVTLAPSNSLVTEGKKACVYFTDVFEQYLERELLPVTYGDVLVDTKQGCTIWSTDSVFAFFARQFVSHGWKVDQIIQVTEAEGVWKDKEKHIYKEITPEMKEEVQSQMVDTKGFDVTGGMWHKIEEALSLSELGIPTRILSGLIPGALKETLQGSDHYGTVIHQV